MTEPKSLNPPLHTLPHDSGIMLDSWFLIVCDSSWLTRAVSSFSDQKMAPLTIALSKWTWLDLSTSHLHISRAVALRPFSPCPHPTLLLTEADSDFRLADGLARPSFSCSFALAFIWSLHCRPFLCVPLHSCFSPVLLLTRQQDFCGLLLLELYAKCLFLVLSMSQQCDQHCMSQYIVMS